eukprot:1736442-Alexandrium_andersonii.AAC.1
MLGASTGSSKVLHRLEQSPPEVLALGRVGRGGGGRAPGLALAAALAAITALSLGLALGLAL